MQLVADAVFVGASGGDDEEQRLLTGIAGAFGQHVIELAVGLGVYLVKHQAGHVQTMLGAGLRRKHLVVAVVAVVDDAFLGGGDLGSAHEGRGHLHHLLRHIEHNGRLVAVAGRAVDLCRLLVVSVEQIQSHRRRQLRLALLLGYLHIGRQELALAVLLHDAEDVPHDLLLPGKQHEWGPGPLAFSVAEVLDEGHGPVSLGLVVVGGGEHELGRGVFVGHQEPPPSSFSISSAGSTEPSPAMMRLRAEGVRPNCSQKRSMIFMLVCAMDTCGTC